MKSMLEYLYFHRVNTIYDIPIKYNIIIKLYNRHSKGLNDIINVFQRTFTFL